MPVQTEHAFRQLTAPTGSAWRPGGPRHASDMISPMIEGTADGDRRQEQNAHSERAAPACVLSDGGAGWARGRGGEGRSQAGKATLR
jgi:hypothetical protein